MTNSFDIDLFDHNRRAYDALLAMLEERGRACLIHPTGTGKAVIGFKYALDHPDEQIVWLSPPTSTSSTSSTSRPRGSWRRASFPRKGAKRRRS